MHSLQISLAWNGGSFQIAGTWMNVNVESFDKIYVVDFEALVLILDVIISTFSLLFVMFAKEFRGCFKLILVQLDFLTTNWSLQRGVEEGGEEEKQTTEYEIKKKYQKHQRHIIKWDCINSIKRVQRVHREKTNQNPKLTRLCFL